MKKRNILECMTLVGETPSYYEGEKTYVSTGAVVCDHIDYNQTEQVNFENRPSRANLSVKAGDILFAKMCGTQKTLRIDKETEEYLFSTGFYAVKANESVMDADLLYHLLSAEQFLAQKDKNSSGATQKAITNAGLKKITVQVPDLSEQRKLVGKLDCIEQMLTKRKEQLALFDQLVKSRFIELFGDPVSNPKGWKVIAFRDAGVRLSDGPFGSNLKSEHYTLDGVRVIRLGNIGVGQFIDDDKSYISEQHYEKLQKYTCKSGEIIIGTLGDPNPRACLIPKTIEYAINKADCVHYIPKMEILNTKFVCQYINCPETLLLASRMVHGQTRSRISSGQLAGMPIFLPPIELQNQFAAFVEQVDKSKLAVQRSLQELEILKKSLMQQYFG